MTVRQETCQKVLWCTRETRDATDRIWSMIYTTSRVSFVRVHAREADDWTHLDSVRSVYALAELGCQYSLQERSAQTDANDLPRRPEQIRDCTHDPAVSTRAHRQITADAGREMTYCRSRRRGPRARHSRS